MRDVFINALLAQAKVNPEIMLVTGDLGFSVLDRFISEIPRQFINSGVAEQNMTGLSAGLALEGKIVFTYSIANFPTLRALEQIRNDVLYHNANVNIVAVGGGFSYGALGMSHHATEDVGIMRVLPGIRIFAPCDEQETLGLVSELILNPSPSYIRLDKSKVVDNVGDRFVPNKLRKIREGKDVAILGYGGIVSEALCAAEELKNMWGVECAVYSAHTLKPFDTHRLLRIVKEHRALVTLEEHVSAGGLASLCAEAFLASGIFPERYCRMSLENSFSSIVGSQEYLRKCNGLEAASIVKRIVELVRS